MNLRLSFLIMIFTSNLIANNNTEGSFLKLIPSPRIYKASCNNRPIGSYKFQVKSLELGNFLEISNISEDLENEDALIQFMSNNNESDYNSYKNNIHVYVDEIANINSLGEISFNPFKFESFGKEIRITDLVVSESHLKFNYFNPSDLVMHFCSGERLVPPLEKSDADDGEPMYYANY